MQRKTYYEMIKDQQPLSADVEVPLIQLVIVALLIFTTFRALRVQALQIWSFAFCSLKRALRKIWVLCYYMD